MLCPYIFMNQGSYLFLKSLTQNGEGGIRTLGTELPAVQQISNLPLSTTQPPLQVYEYEVYMLFIAMSTLKIGIGQ